MAALGGGRGWEGMATVAVAVLEPELSPCLYCWRERNRTWDRYTTGLVDWMDGTGLDWTLSVGQAKPKLIPIQPQHAPSVRRALIPPLSPHDGGVECG